MAICYCICSEHDITYLFFDFILRELTRQCWIRLCVGYFYTYPEIKKLVDDTVSYKMLRHSFFFKLNVIKRKKWLLFSYSHTKLVTLHVAVTSNLWKSLLPHLHTIVGY